MLVCMILQVSYISVISWLKNSMLRFYTGVEVSAFASH